MPSDSVNKNRNYAVVVILVAFAFGAGLLVGSNSPSPVTGGANFFDGAYLQKIYSNIKAEYINELPSTTDITRGMAKGLVESLGDKYSSYLSPQEAADYLEGNDSAFEGIGVQLDFNGSYTFVLSPLDGYPGQKAGLLAGDLILEVDGSDVSGIRPELVATKIRGQAGTKVKLTVYREAEAKALDFEITRERIDLENITFEKLDNGVVRIDIVKFTEGREEGKDPVKVFNDAWDKVANQVKSLSPSAIVLDLRNNPGGYVDSVKYVAEEFLSKGNIIMQEEDKQGSREQIRDYRDGKFETVPLVVLVNEGSASASEILAAAIQENGRGKVVGMPTVGKGVEQKVLPLDDDGLLFLVFKRWLTPKANQLSPESPVTPDVEVKFDPAVGTDNQLTRALESLAGN